MKVNISFNWISAIMLLMFLITSIYMLSMALTYQNKVMDFEKYQNSLSSVVFDYSCPSYVSAFFNCNATGQFMNMTGKYCYGVLVCENKWRIK